ncbi:hypothetical protein [Fluviispira multicolorata]|uniref:Uncharacterized protein n=1 Tax=Fluviispira multicolorata TaxID=2654512 RepID=A0A833JCE1_9BACT|nr:hypothetical protein [Fluviispira multicolorata]KAB8029208.1 hypothetical protein GCL57_11775 [Fluviispira multicolorata]
MSNEIMVLDNVNTLRAELNKIPRARLQFSKVILDFFDSYNISLSGDLLGQLTIATCKEIVSDEEELNTSWTN